MEFAAGFLPIGACISYCTCAPLRVARCHRVQRLVVIWQHSRWGSLSGMLRPLACLWCALLLRLRCGCACVVGWLWPWVRCSSYRTRACPHAVHCCMYAQLLRGLGLPQQPPLSWLVLFWCLFCCVAWTFTARALLTTLICAAHEWWASPACRSGWLPRWLYYACLPLPVCGVCLCSLAIWQQLPAGVRLSVGLPLQAGSPRGTCSLVVVVPCPNLSRLCQLGLVP